MKKVYIVIPIYNGEQYIDRCLTSILNQSYKNYSIICINDGSKDGTLCKLKTYGNQIHIIDKDNGGVSSARNYGIDFAIKECFDSYICFIDIDDYIDSDYLENLVSLLEENKCDISCCSYVYQFNERSKKFIQTDKEKIFSSFEATNKLLEDKTIQSHSHCKLFKTPLWEGVRFPVGVASMEDQATIFKTFCKAKNGVFINNYCGYHYWQEGTSACRTPLTNKKIVDSLIGYLEPCLFDFLNYNSEEKNILLSSSCNALANVYLMVSPFFNKKTATKDQITKFASVKKYISKNKLIKKFKPNNKKERIKKRVYLFLRPFYNALFRLYKEL